MIRLDNNIDGSIIATIESRFIGLEFLRNWTYGYGETIWKDQRFLFPVVYGNERATYDLVSNLVKSKIARRLNYEETAELVTRNMKILKESMINRGQDNG